LLLEPPLVLGCSRLGSALTPMDRRAGLAFIDEAFALGIRHFDTASIYGQGDSERWLGQALRGRRELVSLASKAGQRLTAKQALMARAKPLVRWLAARRPGLRAQVGTQRAAGVPRCFEPDIIERSLHASLRRLGTDHLDLFYLHSPAPEVLDDDALLLRIEQLRAAGLFRRFGVSCDDAAQLQRALGCPLAQVVQFDIADAEDLPALLAVLALQGRQAVLRGFTAGGAGGEILARRLVAAMGRAAVGGVIVGTTRSTHLRDNVAAYEKALAQRAPAVSA
uniref:aldo/keto reductase n=1 Tax=Pelomonas sp. KK5 TaxID=1855730 RepID=UPI00097C3D05